MNICIRCGKETKNKKYCSMHCHNLIPWNKNLSNNTDNRVARISIESGISRRGKPTWNKNISGYKILNSKYMGAHKGDKHTKVWNINISNSLKGKPGRVGEKNGMFGRVAYGNYRFVESLGHNVHSSWEEKICLLLKDNNIEYEYEPQSYRLTINGKKCTYRPDIKIRDLFIEIKGPIYDYQIAKMQEFKKNNKFIIVCGNQYLQKMIDIGFTCFSYQKIINNEINIKNIIGDNIDA